MAKKRKSWSMAGAANRLHGLAGSHHDLLLAYKTEAAFIRSKIDKAEMLILKIEASGSADLDEPMRTMYAACIEMVQYLEGVIEPMEEVIAKMEAFAPTEWANGLMDARDTIRAAKDKFPKIFRRKSE